MGSGNYFARAQGPPSDCLSAPLDLRPNALLCVYTRGENSNLTVTTMVMTTTMTTMMTKEWSKVTKLTKLTEFTL